MSNLNTEPLLKVLHETETWEQEECPDELVDDGRVGNGWIFSVPLCSSLYRPSAPLAFPLTSPLTSLWFLLHTFSLFRSPLLSPRLGHSPNKPSQKMIIHKNVVEDIGRPDPEKVRHPAEMSSTLNAWFRLAFLSVTGCFNDSAVFLSHVQNTAGGSLISYHHKLSGHLRWCLLRVTAFAPGDWLLLDFYGHSTRRPDTESEERLTRTFAFTHKRPLEKIRGVRCMSEAAIVFHIGLSHPARKNVNNTRHVLVNVSCCLKGACSISCFGRTPSFCMWQAESLLFGLN